MGLPLLLLLGGVLSHESAHILQYDGVYEGSKVTTVPTFALSNGVELPQLGFGTWQLDSNSATTEVQRVCSLAKPASIDTSPDYGNQLTVGEALKGQPIGSYFLTTKINPESDFTAANAYLRSMAQLEGNLKELGVSQVDLVLIHFPAAMAFQSNSVGPTNMGTNQACTVEAEMWRAMEAFYTSKKARAIGVSNFCPSTFACILPNATVVPHVNQVNYHVGMGDDPGGIRSFCKSKGTQLQAYSVLGAPSHVKQVLASPALLKIAKAHSVSAATIAERWAVQKGVAIVTTSTQSEHLREALKVFSLTLSGAEMSELDALSIVGGDGPGGADYSFVCKE